MDKPLWMWGVFLAVVLALLALDLGVFNKRDHVIEIRESLLFSAFYIVIAILFGIWVWYEAGAQSGKEYFTGYLIEKTLSLDNLFVMSLIFTHLAIPRKFQHRVLFWGILGVLVLRGMMIGAGSALVQEFHFVLYVFGAFLVLTGFKMLFIVNDQNDDISKNRLLLFLKRYLPVTENIHGNYFVVRLPHPERAHKKVFFITPLLLCLVFIECIDVVFAIDSVPAVFAITTDVFVIYTSNIFAILGLRSLYFALDGMLHRFIYLKYALALVLIFIGSKIFIADWFDLPQFPVSISLSVTIFLLMAGIILSLLKK